ncbi:hypothetical protein F4779DRAFT_618841 [Xylariaceae sp. FL0662B]|nr:hypothetical protein F4779DRAFT_618841 [Xylariaceae sp. FL0662B]
MPATATPPELVNPVSLDTILLVTLCLCATILGAAWLFMTLEGVPTDLEGGLGHLSDVVREENWAVRTELLRNRDRGYEADDELNSDDSDGYGGSLASRQPLLGNRPR